MKKSTIENVCIAIILIAWLVLIFFVLQIENEALKIMALLGVLLVGYFVAVTCHWLDTYKKYKEQYYLMREEDKKRRVSYCKGNENEVFMHSEKIEANEYDMIEMGEFLSKNALWMPKKKLRQMSKDVDRMMSFYKRHPPI